MEGTGAATALAARPRDRILDAATALFSREGVQAVGVDRVIAAAEVAPMTLYRHFDGKDELVAAALERWSDDWLRWLREQLDRRGADPWARLAALWEALEAWFGAEGFRGSFVANAATELRGRPDHPAQRVIGAHRAALRRLLQEVTGAAGAADPAGLAAQLQVLRDGAVAVAAVDRRPDVAASARTLAAAALLAGPARAGT
jgi:AcrR family transcriptional regulator